jgi:hypothetical protein
MNSAQAEQKLGRLIDRATVLAGVSSRLATHGASVAQQRAEAERVRDALLEEADVDGLWRLMQSFRNLDTLAKEIAQMQALLAQAGAANAASRRRLRLVTAQLALPL